QGYQDDHDHDHPHDHEVQEVQNTAISKLLVPHDRVDGHEVQEVQNTAISNENDHQHQIVKLKEEYVDSVIISRAVSKAHADKFAHLIIQDQGRMKPINTFASELL